MLLPLLLAMAFSFLLFFFSFSFFFIFFFFFISHHVVARAVTICVPPLHRARPAPAEMRQRACFPDAPIATT